MNVYSELKDIALGHGLHFSKTIITEEGQITDVVLSKDGLKIHVLCLKEEDHFVAYDFSSEFLPSEIYRDDLQNRFTPKERSFEIIYNLKHILDKDLLFHHDPSLFHKKRGFIYLNIDGMERKIYMKDNYFELPTSV